MVSQQDIAQFWQWFNSVCSQFGEHFQNQQLLDELDAKVAQLGRFSWELGPGLRDGRNSSLVLTPSGDPALLMETREVVGAAPECSGWEFYPAKPPKRWQRRFALRNEEGDEIPVDASGARYILLGYPDGVFDLSLADRNLAALPRHLQQTATEVLLDGELGEEQRMRLIHGIEVGPEFDDEMRKKSSAIEALSRHLQSLVRQG